MVQKGEAMQKETKTEVYQAADDFLMSPKVDFCFKELFQSPNPCLTLGLFNNSLK